ncbi:MAG: DUF4331 family protein [Polyangiaceae bacterium]|nr:DUF4331 family protein [Polyangiaceae bacterium]
MRRTIWLGGAAALAMASITSVASAADHLDSPAVKKDAAADITDVYAWSEGSNMLLVLNVAPLATVDSKFSDAVQYALHLESTGAFGMPGEKHDVICTFDADQKISCWIGDKDYVTGDASNTDGLKSASGKFRVFAGLRADPFFFNLAGFQDAVSTVKGAAASLTFDGAGCPQLDANTATTIVNLLKSTNGGQGAAENFFATVNVLSIVLEVDKSLVTGGGDIVSVWGSTHQAGG